MITRFALSSLLAILILSSISVYASTLEELRTYCSVCHNGIKAPSLNETFSLLCSWSRVYDSPDEAFMKQYGVSLSSFLDRMLSKVNASRDMVRRAEAFIEGFFEACKRLNVTGRVVKEVVRMPQTVTVTVYETVRVPSGSPGEDYKLLGQATLVGVVLVFAAVATLLYSLRKAYHQGVG